MGRRRLPVWAGPRVGVGALGEVGSGALYGVAWVCAAGVGTVTATTYEYGNTFLIVAGLLNCLVTIDAYDIALGRK